MSPTWDRLGRFQADDVRHGWSWSLALLVLVVGLLLNWLLWWLQPQLEGAVFAVEIGFVVATAEWLGVGAGIVAAIVGLFSLADRVTPSLFMIGPLHVAHLLQLVIYAVVVAAVLAMVAGGQRSERRLQLSHAAAQATNMRLRALSDMLATLSDSPLDVAERADRAVRQLCHSFASIAVMEVQAPSLGEDRISWSKGREGATGDPTSVWIPKLVHSTAFAKASPPGNQPVLLEPDVIAEAVGDVGGSAEVSGSRMAGACVRLCAKGRPLGMVWILWHAQRVGHTTYPLSFFADLGTAIAVGLDNAERYREAVVAIQGRDTVLAAVSHDLKNPLSAIQLSVDVLQKTQSDQPGSAVSIRLLRHIERAVQRMTIMIRDLLDQARNEALAMRLERAELAVEDLLNEAVAVMTPQAEERAQSLVVTVAPNLPPIQADRDRLMQVLSNLIGNACKFSPSGARIHVAAAAEREMVRCCVSDRGAGIAPADLPHIFERFWQATPTTGTTGSGLGLSIARSIVEAHGGRIWAESQLGAGTTLCFTVPQAQPHAEHPVQAA